MNKKNGFTLIEVLALIVIASAIIFFILPSFNQRSHHKSVGNKCKANLSQFGKGMSLYLLDLGRQVHYPQNSGQGFVASLFRARMLIEPEVYLCPDTTDSNSELEIDRGLAVRSPSIANSPQSGTSVGPISYAGRLNKNQNIYPGIYRPTEETTTTPMMSDDFGNPHNHENGTIIQFLFVDGHTDHYRLPSLNYWPFVDVLGN